jgi:hypothetical protein
MGFESVKDEDQNTHSASQAINGREKGFRRAGASHVM